MKTTTERAIEAAMDEYQRDIATALRNNAARAHIAGDLKAHKLLNIGISFDLVQKEALEYSKLYGEVLYREGASVIQGKKIPWLKEHTGRTRERVFKTIRDGLKDGKPVSEIGGIKIGKGTIAYDLKQIAGMEDRSVVGIARTEVARISNQGALTRYDKNNVTGVDVLDNEGPNSCDACIEANGQRWTLAYARTHELEHPNCVRAFTPVIKRK